ncbi:hypothetical protein CARUB_v10010801mg [Capsella rubella]|uniref:Uncharacterized protein n=1 Tax=Capsella rubella TaxID=81985 RepID=R0I4P0_9BRAS|nr:hypothetical protein CARUB_v10010801mg [Capsella rubella]
MWYAYDYNQCHQKKRCYYDHDMWYGFDDNYDELEDYERLCDDFEDYCGHLCGEFEDYQFIMSTFVMMMMMMVASSS